MAIVGPVGLLRLIREVSVGEIRKQADRTPRVVVCGTPEEREGVRRLLLADSADEVEHARLAEALVEVDLPLEGDEVVRSMAAQVVFTAQAPDASLLRLKVPVFQVTDAGSVHRAAARLAEQEEDWIVSLGRHVPALRHAMGEHLTGLTSSANAQIALISALPGVVPITQVLLPTAAVADIVLLTKNQMMLVLKLAAMYGKPVQIAGRVWELASVVGGAFGWRALAREVVGAVPGGVGVATKATVAYAGTYTVGRAAQIYYARGERLSRAEERHIFREALDRARSVVGAMLVRFRRGRPEAQDEPAPEAREEDAT